MSPNTTTHPGPTGVSGPGALARAVVEAMESLAQAADATSAPGWEWAERAAVIASLDRVGELVGLYRARLLAVHKDDGRWASAGDRTFENHRARLARTPLAAARAETELGQGLAEMPVAADAVQQGQVGLAHARVLTRLRAAASSAVRKALDAGGATELLALATDLDVATFTRRAQAWAAAQDVDAAEADFERVHARRYARITDRDGGTQIDAFVDPVVGASLRTALEALTPVPAAEDARTPGQRAADALATMAARILDAGADKVGAQIRPHLSLIVPTDTWAAVRARRDATGTGTGTGTVTGTGTDLPRCGRTSTQAVVMPELDDGTPVPLTELERLACDCEVTRVVLAADSVPLDVGRTQRTYSKELRRAVLVRDGHCRWPGCSMRSSWCDVHHIRAYADGGCTSAQNAITLCGFHHRQVHARRILITPTPGGHRFSRRDGSTIGVTTRGTGIDRMLPATQASTGSERANTGSARANTGSEKASAASAQGIAGNGRASAGSKRASAANAQANPVNGAASAEGTTETSASTAATAAALLPLPSNGSVDPWDDQ